MTSPTPYPDLNDVLRELVSGTQAILADSFCGAYLQGSFAVGDADVYSDVDFLVVMNDELSGARLTALQVMHERLHAIEIAWAQHLEGSYISRDRLRRIDASRSPLPYLDNGAHTLVWDNHCNTAVVRWSLREHGVVLAGPAPETLVDPVSAEQVRSEVLATMGEFAAWAPAPTKAGPMSRWKQPYLVLTFCRMLHTMSSGRIASKRAAGEWAVGALEGEWASLIRRALDDRPDPWLRVHQQADPEDAERTLAFVDYALKEATTRYAAGTRRC